MQKQHGSALYSKAGSGFIGEMVQICTVKGVIEQSGHGQSTKLPYEQVILPFS